MIEINPIATIKTDFNEKFGVPRQSTLCENAKGIIVFDKEYRDENALKGLEDFKYIWVLWIFDVPRKEKFVPLVRPPRLGGNTYMGVFATRSPFRPNRIGLSSLKIERIYSTKDYGTVIEVSGVDMVDGTKIIDIKPYLKYVDCHEDANNGFAEESKQYRLEVLIDENLLKDFPREKVKALEEILSLDPRPSYQEDEAREYGLNFSGFNINFRVSEGKLTVTKINKNNL